jgi:hypothetical protein
MKGGGNNNENSHHLKIARLNFLYHCIILAPEYLMFLLICQIIIVSIVYSRLEEFKTFLYSHLT